MGASARLLPFSSRTIDVHPRLAKKLHSIADSTGSYTKIFPMQEKHSFSRRARHIWQRDTSLSDMLPTPNTTSSTTIGAFMAGRVFPPSYSFTLRSTLSKIKLPVSRSRVHNLDWICTGIGPLKQPREERPGSSAVQQRLTPTPAVSHGLLISRLSPSVCRSTAIYNA